MTITQGNDNNQGKCQTIQISENNTVEFIKLLTSAEKNEFGYDTKNSTVNGSKSLWNAIHNSKRDDRYFKTCAI